MLTVVAVVGMPLVGGIGFAASYATLERFAERNGFGALSGWFPIGIDAAIIALLALDLVLVRIGKGWPVLRFAAHAMTLATVVFNASDGLDTDRAGGLWPALAADPLRALSHAVMPVLFVLGVEAVRHLLKHTAQIEEVKPDRIPLHRWVLSPVATPRLYRRMRLANVRSYAEMVRREQDLHGYTVWLKQHKGDLSKASEVERLPLTMAPRGFTVDEALALPEQWEKEAAERAEAKAERERLEAERRRQEKRREAEQKRDDRIASVNDDAAVKAAEHLAAARTDEALSAAETARAVAEQRRVQAERTAQREAEALESAEAAAALRKAEEDNRIAAQARRITAEEKAQEAKAKAEAERLKAQTQESATRRAIDKQREDEALAAAQLAREQAARAEAAAQAAEDYARLSPRERNIRRVARMLLAANPHATDASEINQDAVPLAAIQEELPASRTTAGELRQEAMTLLAGGYQGTEEDYRA
jgi:hypothetical protein